jgi:hypothetical protein
MINVDIYPSRIEIYPYEKPQKYDQVVAKCSKLWNPSKHTRENLCSYYDKDNHKLIVMRGIDITWLCSTVDGYPQYMNSSQSARMKYKHKVKFRPRSQDQMRAIKFLCGYGEFSRFGKYNQLSLNTEPGFGKTYCAITAALERGYRTLIIVHNTTIKNQWIDSILEKTDVTRERILDVTGSDNMKKILSEDIDADFIITLHQSITSYFTSEGYEKTKEWFDHLECGTKIIDEVHLFFGSTVQVDFCSNIQKTFYLTGTMTRSDPLEIGLFKRYFSNTPSFGQELDKTKNVRYYFIDYDSAPSLQSQAYIMTKRGPNSSKFIDYAINIDPSQTILSMMYKVLEEAKTHEGKILMVVPKIDIAEYIKDKLTTLYPEDTIRTIHSRHSAEDNNDSKENATIIISTIGSLGTGSDIEGLRNLIIMDLYSSEVTANQLPKRLRPLPNGEDSYCYELVDCGFEPLVSMVRKKTRYLKKCCKSVTHKVIS